MQDRLQYSPVKLYLHSFVIDPVPNLGLNQADSFIQFEVGSRAFAALYVCIFLSRLYVKQFIHTVGGRFTRILPRFMLVFHYVKQIHSYSWRLVHAQFAALYVSIS